MVTRHEHLADLRRRLTARTFNLSIWRWRGQFRQRMNRGTSHAGRTGKLFALACAFALLIASILSSAPGLHEWIHDTSSASHQCAATLMSSGNCNQAECTGPSCDPPPSCVQTSFLPPAFRFTSERLEFSLREHAPPAIS